MSSGDDWRAKDEGFNGYGIPADGAPDLMRREFLRLVGGLGIGMAGGLFLDRHSKANLASAENLEHRNYKMDRMIYRRLGKTNMMVSTIALGGSANYGEGQWATDDPNAYQEMLERLLELGVNLFDTSPDYGTEKNFSYLCTPANRERVFLSTKLNDVSPSGTRTSVENSLDAMGTDYIDLVYIHNGRGVSGNDYGGALACFDVLDEMILEGKVRFKGMTAHNYGLLTGLLNAYADRVDVIMGFYCPIDDAFQWYEGTVTAWQSLYSLARSKDVGVVAMKVLLSALDPWSSRKDMLKNDSEAWTRLQPFLEMGYTVPQACIRWALSNKEVHTAVVGMRTVSEAEEDVFVISPTGPAKTIVGGSGGGGG